jgi:hypothetical protein
MEYCDRETVAAVVSRLKRGDEPLLPCDAQAIWESEDREWFENWVQTPQFVKAYRAGHKHSHFPVRTYKPAGYVFPALRTLIADKDFGEVIKVISLARDPVFAGNLRTGDPDVLRQTTIVSESVGRFGSAEFYKGHCRTTAGIEWEAISPLLLRAAPEVAASVIRAHAQRIAELDDPRFLAGDLAQGAAVILDPTQHGALKGTLTRYQDSPEAPDKDYWGCQLLKAHVISASTLDDACEALFAGPTRFFRHLAALLNHTVWYACGCPALVQRLANALAVSAYPEEQQALLHALWWCGHHDPEVSRTAARRLQDTGDTGVSFAAVSLLATVGEQQDSEALWARIGELDLLSNDARARSLALAGLFWRHAASLSMPAMNVLVSKVPLWLIGMLLDKRDEGQKSDDFAAAARAALSARSKTEVNLGSQGIAFLLRHRPTVIREFCELASGTNSKSQDFRFLFSQTAWQLGTAILAHDAPLAFRIFDAMQQDSFMHLTAHPAGAEVWRCALAASSHKPEVAEYMKVRMGQYSSEKEAFGWALAIRQSGSDDWSMVHELWRDADPRKRAIAVRVFGWSATNCEPELRQSSLGDGNRYVRRAARDALEDWWAEKWARHWYGEIFKANTDAGAWAAQELCRAVADRRLFLWCDTVDPTVLKSETSWKRRYLVSELVNSKLGDKWERKLQDHGFGQNVGSIRSDI